MPGQAGQIRGGGAQMVRVCDGKSLPKGDPARSICCARSAARRTRSGTSPIPPIRCSSRASAGLKDTHKSWWECDTGIAFLVSGAPGWRTRRMTQVYDLSDPAQPVKIRDFGLPGQEPGSTGAVPTELHGPISTGPQRQPRLFRLWHQQGRRRADRRPRQADQRSEGADAGESARTRSHRGSICRRSTAPTRRFRCCGMPIAEFAKDKDGKTAGHRHDRRRGDRSTNATKPRQMVWFADVTVEAGRW